MKLLVTGGAGFMGSNFIYYMLDKYPDYELVCLDLLTYAGHKSTIKDLFNHPNFTFVHGDIRDRELVDQLFAEGNFDTAVNFAAESHVDNSIEDPAAFLETNILGTQIVMDAARKYNLQRFHQVSTDEVYGELPLDRPELKFTEESPIKTSSPYSASKASADLLAAAYHRTYELPLSISRSSNNYGPYQLPEKLIPLMIVKALNNEKMPVYGTGENIRDWLYVDDHSRALDLIIHQGRVGEVYNIGGSSEKSNIEVVKMILKELNKAESLITFVEDRPGHDLRYAVDYGKIAGEIGWQPEVDFKSGIKRTIKWYLDNKSWWQEILNKS